LAAIFNALQDYRGFRDFVKARYIDADFFVVNPGFVVEFDESQHFTGPRKISLEMYPEEKKTGYPKERWIAYCDKMDKRDNDPPYRDEQRAWYDTLRDFLPEIKGFQATVRLYAGEMEWCRMDPGNPVDIEKFRSLLADKMAVVPAGMELPGVPPRQSSVFVATILLASHLRTPEWGLKQEKDPALNEMRMTEMMQVLRTVVSKTHGDGVILFPGGWFHSGYEPAGSLYQWVSEGVVREITGTGRRIIVSLGIDGSFDRPVEEDPYDRDQIALAIDKTGIIAAGRKFFPGPGEGPFISVAPGHLENEAGFPRIFALNGVRYYLFECNDLKAPYHDAAKYPDPGVDIGLNLIHRIYAKGEPLSQENNFPCIFGARTAYQWNIPVFLSVIFFRDNVPEGWPSGVFCTRATSHRIGYDEIALPRDTLDKIPLTEGYAEVRVFRDISAGIRQLKDRALPAGKSSGSPAGKTAPVARKKERMGSPEVPAGKYRPGFEAIIREYEKIIPPAFRMHGTASRTNRVVRAKDHPDALHYEFQDWGDKFSVEICLEKSRLPEKEAVFQKLTEKKFADLPGPVLKSQANGWLRLLFYFPEETPSADIAAAMNRLIGLSWPEMKDN
jgi:hypothetical protein